MTDIAARPRRGRPPKIPREHGDTREALLRCGMAVLTMQGISATGIDTVLKRVGVPKGSFYHYFDSKDAFGFEVLHRYAGYFARKLDRWLLEEGPSPLERLARFVNDAKAGMVRHDFERGCLVGNLGQEVSTLPEGYREALEDVLRDWERRVALGHGVSNSRARLAALHGDDADLRLSAATPSGTTAHLVLPFRTAA